MEQDKFNILNDKEEKIKKRLFAISSLESHDNYFYKLFESNTNFTEKQIGAIDGFYHLAGRGMTGQIIDDNLANICIKWILTGENKYYRIIKYWFIWHLNERIKSKQIEQQRYNQIEKETKTKRGYIYLIRSKNLYKIGRALQLKERIKIYKTENPFGVKVVFQKEVDDYVGKEVKLLEKFQEKRAKGKEWFKLNQEDVNWIKQNV